MATQQFMEDRGRMLASRDEALSQSQKDDPNKVTLKPMTPLSASSTVVNLLLATGPFS